MTRVFLGICLSVTLVWATACSDDDDKKKTNTNKICTEDSECSDPFFECEHINTTTTGTCTKPCTGEADCPDDHSCQSGSSIGLEPSCIATCNPSRGCPQGHNCVTNSEQLSVCIPAAWGSS
jgi:hypothetical protein